MATIVTNNGDIIDTKKVLKYCIFNDKIVFYFAIPEICVTLKFSKPISDKNYIYKNAIKYVIVDKLLSIDIFFEYEIMDIENFIKKNLKRIVEAIAQCYFDRESKNVLCEKPFAYIYDKTGNNLNKTLIKIEGNTLCLRPQIEDEDSNAIHKIINDGYLEN